MTAQFRFGRRSEANLVGVHPDLVRVARLALLRSEIDFAVIEGLRTPERQRELVRSGASQTLNGRHITGHAIDVAAWINGQIDWSWPLYHQVAAAFKSAAADIGIPITWGGDWTTFPDGPHFELSRSAYP
jgi:peptidoglycan L-alanyl-D-glutamate endopeptidase CwlK